MASPFHERINLVRVARLEQNVQYRDEQGEGKHVKDGGKDVQHNRRHNISFIGRNESPHELEKFFHKGTDGL